MIRFLLAALMCCLYVHAFMSGFRIGTRTRREGKVVHVTVPGKRYSEVYAGSWVWYDHSVHCTAVKEGELVTNQTRNLLRCFGLEMFLVSFETLGEAIDIARESLLEPGYHRDYYSILGDRYGVSRKKINDDIRRAVAVAWRLHRDIMEETLGEIYERPPTPRRFVYAAADYLNKKEVEEMSD